MAAGRPGPAEEADAGWQGRPVGEGDGCWAMPGQGNGRQRQRSTEVVAGGADATTDTGRLGFAGP